MIATGLNISEKMLKVTSSIWLLQPFESWKVLFSFLYANIQIWNVDSLLHSTYV